MEYKKIKEIAFMLGTQGGGYKDHVITFDKNKVIKYYENFMYHEKSEGKLKLNKKEFLEKFKSLNIEDWNDSYVVFYKIDGYSWELNIFFEDDDPIIKKGSNNYPDNIDDLLELLEIDFNLEDELYN